MTSIKHFANEQTVNVQGHHKRETGHGYSVPALVSIHCYTSGFGFTHNMTPESAREMASALLAAAEEVEPVKVAEAA